MVGLCLIRDRSMTDVRLMCGWSVVESRLSVVDVRSNFYVCCEFDVRLASGCFVVAGCSICGCFAVIA